MAKKCMSCGGSMNKMQKGGTAVEKAQKVVDQRKLENIRKYAKMKQDKGLVPPPPPPSKMYKQGGSVKMQKGGTMKTTVGGPAKKPFAAGIPYYTGAGQTGPESMQVGGALKGVKTLYKGSKILNKAKSLVNNKITKGATGPMTKTAMRLRATGKKK